jgi:hypothetical protein
VPAITLETVNHLAALSNPHMKAINDAITAAYPEHPDAMYTAALAFHLCTLLNALDPADRPDAVKLINEFLTNTHLGYRLQPVTDHATAH